MKKRIISAILVLCLALGLMSITVYAVENVEVVGIENGKVYCGDRYFSLNISENSRVTMVGYATNNTVVPLSADLQGMYKISAGSGEVAIIISGQEEFEIAEGLRFTMDFSILLKITVTEGHIAKGPKSHACEYCDEPISLCEDSDLDCYCDICEQLMPCSEVDITLEGNPGLSGEQMLILTGSAHQYKYPNSELEPVIVEAAEGYYFPEDYLDHILVAADWLHVTRDSAKQLSITGTFPSEIVRTGINISLPDWCDHPDEGRDHKCDNGCTVALGTCEDKDCDHKCDYGCKKFFGEHKADEGTHICSYCKENVSDCKDKTPKDHLCDICGATLSSHSGGTATCLDKAICEYCGQKYDEVNSICHVGNRVFLNKGNSHLQYWDCCGMYSGSHTPTDKNHDNKCDICGIYYSDGKEEWTEIEIVVPVEAGIEEAEETSPKTSDNSLFVLCFIWGAILTCASICYRRGRDYIVI